MVSALKVWQSDTTTCRLYASRPKTSSLSMLMYSPRMSSLSVDPDCRIVNQGSGACWLAQPPTVLHSRGRFSNTRAAVSCSFSYFHRLEL